MKEALETVERIDLFVNKDKDKDIDNDLACQAAITITAIVTLGMSFIIKYFINWEIEMDPDIFTPSKAYIENP